MERGYMGFHMCHYTDDTERTTNNNLIECVNDTAQSIKCVAHGNISSVVPFPYVLRFFNIRVLKKLFQEMRTFTDRFSVFSDGL